MGKYSENINRLKSFGTPYAKKEMFREKPIPEKEMVYDKNFLVIGKYADKTHPKFGQPYYIDLSQALRILLLGMTRCLPIGTKIRTENGLVKIEDVDKVLSYNFEKKRIEEKQAIVHNRNFQKLVKITTPKGIIKCSPNHKWYVRRDNQIKIIETKDLLLTDKFVKCYPHYCKILNIEFTDEEVEMVDIEVKDNNNFILENGVVSRNSGKSWLISAILSRIIETKERSAIFLNDCKREFAHMNKPLQAKFKHLLYSNEVPKGFKVISLRPTYFKTIKILEKKKHENDIWYSPKFSEMSKDDFITLMGGAKPSRPLAMALDLIYQRLEKIFKHNSEIDFSVELINEVIDSITEITPVQGKNLKFIFKSLGESKLFEKEHEVDMAEVMSRGYYPSINMKNYDYFQKSPYNFNSLILAMTQKEVIRARIQKKIKPVFIVLDEMAVFINNKIQSSFKDDTLTAVNVYTSEHVNFCLEENTIIKTNNGNKKIKDLDETKDKTVSWDFENNKLVETKFKKYKTGKKKLLKISLTSELEIKLTKEHIMFRWNEKNLNNIEEVKTRDLMVGDYLVKWDNTLFLNRLTDERILKIEEIDEEECYDLEVPEYHNFFLGNRILSHNCFATQIIKDVPENILVQSKYLMIPKTADVDTIKTLLLSSGATRYIQRAYQDATKYKQKLRGIDFSWLVINRYTDTVDLIVPLAPLSYIKETAEN